MEPLRPPSSVRQAHRVPPFAPPPSQLMVQAPTGQYLHVVVPPGVVAGGKFRVQLPEQPPAQPLVSRAPARAAPEARAGPATVRCLAGPPLAPSAQEHS